MYFVSPLFLAWTRKYLNRSQPLRPNRPLKYCEPNERQLMASADKHHTDAVNELQRVKRPALWNIGPLCNLERVWLFDYHDESIPRDYLFQYKRVLLKTSLVRVIKERYSVVSDLSTEMLLFPMCHTHLTLGHLEKCNVIGNMTCILSMNNEVSMFPDVEI